MRPMMKTPMCVLLAAGFAAPAAAAPAYYLKLAGVDGEATNTADKHKNEIEILSWSWGTSRSHGAGGGGGAGKVSVHDISMAPAPSTRESGEMGGTEDINIGVGELQEAPAPGGVRVAVGDLNGDGAAAPRKPTTSTATTNPRKLPGAAPAEKRQHGWTTVSKPLDRGAVRVKVKMPWLGCAVGARYPVLTLGGGAGQTYELTNAVVTNCGSAASGGESLPLEEVSFNYGKVKVRAWNPSKKEE